MVQQQTLADYASAIPLSPQEQQRGAGFFAAVRLNDFSAESFAATTVYSRKDFYKISLITGNATYYYRDREYTFKQGECALVFTNTESPYRWDTHGSACNGYSCMFTEDFLPLHTYIRPADWAVFKPDGQSVFWLDNRDKELFTGLFQKMLAEQTSAYANKYDLLFLYVLECIHSALKLKPATETHTHTAAARITEGFKALLAGQFPLVTPLQRLSLRTPQAFAEKLAVHTNYLNRALKEVTGKTTTQLITERMMQEARALLLHSDWPVNQISNCLGFDESTHFAQAFRKHTGQPPSALRQGV